MAADTKTLKVVVIGDSSQAQRSIKDVGKSADDTSKKAGGLSDKLGGLKTVLGAGLALGGISALGSFFKDSIDGAAEAAKGTRVLHSQIANLGPAGRNAFKQAEEFASDFGAQIGVDDDDIKAVQTKLASFPDAFKKGSLGAEGMERSVKAAFDLQAIGIGSAESNIVGLGKAMNDPVKGMNALAKSGVSFSAIQKEQIQHAMKQGDLAGAQKILLQGIESNAKGAAEAAVSPMQKMQVAISDAGEKVAGLLLPKMTQFADFVVTRVLPKFVELTDLIGPKIGAAFSIAGRMLSGFFAILSNPIVRTFAVGILAIVAALQAYSLYVTIVSGVTKAWAAIQAALNIVMAMNPIALIILAIVGLVAAIAYAWTHFAGFRNVVISVWNGIKAAALAVVSWFMSYVWPTLVAIFNGLKFVVIVYYTVWKTIFLAVIAAVRAVVNFFTGTLWPGIKRVFDAIVSAARALWNAYAAIFGWILAKVQSVFQWIRNTGWAIISGAFTLIKNAISTLWNGWKTTFDLIKSKVETVMNAAKTAFTNAKDGIGNAWAKLQDLAKKPVNFVIETVYNNGILKFWNAIASKVNLPQLAPLAKLAGGGVLSKSDVAGDNMPLFGQAGEYMLNRKQVAKAGGWRGIEELFGPAGRDGASAGNYAAGGLVGGLKNAGSWLKDQGTSLVKGSLLKISEPVINAIKAAIKTIPGTGDIADAVRKMPTNLLDKVLAWIKPKDIAPLDGALGGPLGAIGVIPDWVKAAKAHSSFGKNSGIGNWLFQVVKAAGLADSNQGIFNVRRTATGNLSMHGYGRAVDLPARMAIFNFLRSHYGSQLKELIFSPAGNSQVYNGRNHMYTGITRQMHFNHVHASYDDGGILPPGVTIAHNNTGRNEYVSAQAPGSTVTVNVTVQGNVTAEKDLAESIATEVRNALLRKAARNGGKTGLK